MENYLLEVEIRASGGLQGGCLVKLKPFTSILTLKKLNYVLILIENEP